MEEKKILAIREVAIRLFGDGSDANRKRVRAMIKQGALKGKRIGDKRGSPTWITRKSFDNFVEDLENL